jgi:hypothetical protein
VWERTERVLEALSYEDRVRPDAFKSVVGDVDTEDTGEEDAAGVGEVAEALLASVNEQPFLSLSERYDAIDVGSKQGNAAKNELLALEVVTEVEIDTGTPGRNPKLLELTDQGEAVLAERGYNVVDTGRRGIEHRYWQRQVADHYESDGFDVQIEQAVDAGRVDVYAERPEESVAVEVAMSPEHELENIQKCLDAAVDRVEVLTADDSVRDQIRSAVRDELGEVPDQVVFKDASTYA